MKKKLTKEQRLQLRQKAQGFSQKQSQNLTELTKLQKGRQEKTKDEKRYLIEKKHLQQEKQLEE